MKFIATMTTMDKKLIQAVRLKRRSEGLSVRKLADIVGISFSALARLERGEGSADPNTRARLVQWLGDDALSLGLHIERVAGVHFRAKKNIPSPAVECLVTLAKSIWAIECNGKAPHFKPRKKSKVPQPRLSKSEMEDMSLDLRADVDLEDDSTFDPLNLVVDGVELVRISEVEENPNNYRVQTEFVNHWSAMTVPLDASGDKWVIVINDLHPVERQRVSLMEELWHIFLGHELVEITRVGGFVGRAFDSEAEHDAYYLAAATLVPRGKVEKLLQGRISVERLAADLGVSRELVEYRIKRLGLWRKYRGRSITLNRNIEL